MKSVSEEEWIKKADGLAEWLKNRTSPPNLDLYKRIVSMVHVGKTTLDVGCGQQYLFDCLPRTIYTGCDPFPIVPDIHICSAEDLRDWSQGFDSVFMLAALDNVRDLKAALEGLKYVAEENIVILTSIGVPPDKNHTVQVDREDLVSVLGEPFQEIEISNKLFLFEWRIK